MKMFRFLAASLLWGFAAGAVSRLRGRAQVYTNATFADEVVRGLISGHHHVHQALRGINKKMTIKEAVHRLNGKLPQDIASLLKVGKDGSVKTAPDLDEDSMAKARNILNDMIYNSITELDDKIIAAKEFENSNRETFDQVNTDLARLGNEISSADKSIVENQAASKSADDAYKAVKANMDAHEQAYMTKKVEDDADMTVKRNDLAVFDFLMTATECSGSSFIQKAKKGTSLMQLNQTKALKHVQVCENSHGIIGLKFNDAKATAKIERKLSPKARLQLRAALGLAFEGRMRHAKPSKASLVQVSAHHFKDDDDETTTTETTTVGLTATAEPTPVEEEPDASYQWKKCVTGTPNCGLLHDTMSLQWGKFKDAVDELQAEMEASEDEWKKLQFNLNSQMEVLADEKSAADAALAYMTGQKNTLTETNNEKSEQSRMLQEEFETQMEKMKKAIEEILYTDICAMRTARNELMTASTVSPPDAISDCEVKDWVAERCSVECDDSCPHFVGNVRDPFSCGGDQTLEREVITVPNEYGIACPPLTRQMRCGQYKCAVDCELSEWTGWSKCTKECEGGSQYKTRSVLIKPKHGGRECAAMSDTRACNTGSCDRDCSLDDWTTWSPCSQSCDPGGLAGFQERERHVIVPIRGEGSCPEPKAEGLRYEKQSCNEQQCIGDEICVAKQDLVLMIDSSGSLKESGWETIRDFAANLTGKYKSTYYGADAVRIGVTIFGNGELEDDGSIAPAEKLVALTGDFEFVKEKIEAATWKKGFTNMAQGFSLAKNMFQLNGRAGAQSAVMVISDGKYSFSYETGQMAEQLKEAGALLFFAPIADFEGDWNVKLKEWSSQPWETNYQLLPGMKAVEHNKDLFSSLLIAKFCSDSISPSAEAVQDEQRGYALIHEGGFPSNACGQWWDLGNVDTEDECAEMTENDYGYLAFSITDPQPWFDNKRHCYAEAIDVTEELYEGWLTSKADIPCPNGAWLPNEMYNVYAIAPSSSS